MDLSSLFEPRSLLPLQQSNAMERSDPYYVESIRFLLDRVNFEKSTETPYDQQSYRLARMRLLLEALGNPQLAAPVIHIAGTKGKGSVAWLVAETLRFGGQKTGLYTSPHLEHLEERFVIDGAPITPEQLVAEIPRLRAAAQRCLESEHGSPTFFELTTALAWCVFQTRGTQINVVEVGLGGRLDSTNVCEPCLAIITSISYDHQQQLGDRLAQIATEKAGIIKKGVPVIHGVCVDEARHVVRTIAQENTSELWELGTDFEAEVQPSFASASAIATASETQPLTFDRLTDRLPSLPLGALRLRMLGRHQADNAALAISAWLRLVQDGWKLPLSGLVRALGETQVPARVQVVRNEPRLILDSAHNEASIEATLSTLKDYFRPRRRTIVFACSKDKKYPEMLRSLLGYADRLIVTQYHSNPRFVPVEHLEAIAREAQQSATRPVEILSSPHVDDAIAYALRTSEPNDLVCVTGSFFTAAEAKAYLARET